MKRIVILLLMILGIFTMVACVVEPNVENKPEDKEQIVNPDNGPQDEVTEAPAPGDVPSIPSKVTTVSAIGVQQREVIQTMLNDLMMTFQNLFGGQEGSKGIDTGMTFGGTVSVSAPAGSITVSGVKIQYSALTGSIVGNGSSVLASVGCTVTITEKGTSTSYNVSAEKDLLGDQNTIIAINVGNDRYEMKTEKVEYNDGYGSYYTRTVLYKNNVMLDYDGEETSEAYVLFEYFAIAGISGLTKATISITDASVTIPVYQTKTITVTVNGTARLNAALNSKFFPDQGTAMFLSGSQLIIDSLTVSINADSFGASGSIEVKDLTMSLDTWKESSESSETKMSRNSQVSVSLDLGKLAICCEYDEIKLSLEVSDTKAVYKYAYSYEYDYTTYQSSRNTDESFRIVTDAGFGLKVGENSVGFAAGFSMNSAEAGEDSDDLFNFTPKAATINGAFYDPQQFLDAIVELGEADFKNAVTAFGGLFKQEPKEPEKPVPIPVPIPAVQNEAGIFSDNLFYNGNFDDDDETGVLEDGSIIEIVADQGIEGSNALLVEQQMNYGEVYIDFTEYYGRGKSYYIEASFRNLGGEGTRTYDITANIDFIVVAGAGYEYQGDIWNVPGQWEGSWMSDYDALDVFGIETNVFGEDISDGEWHTVSGILDAETIDSLLDTETYLCGSDETTMYFLGAAFHVGIWKQDGYRYLLDNIVIKDLNSELETQGRTCFSE